MPTCGVGLLRDDLERRIVRLAIPALGTLAVEPLYVLVDTAIVGRLGTPQLAGLAIASTVLLTVVSLTAALEYGLTPDVAFAHGRGDEHEARRVATNGLQLAALLGVPMGLALGLAARPLCWLLGGRGDVLEYASTYLRISAVGLPFVLVAYVGHGVMRGVNQLRRPFVLVVVANVANLVLEIVAVYWLDLGIAGSAWSTVFVQILAAFAFLGIMRPHLTRLRPAWARIRPVLTSGVHFAVRSLAMFAVWNSATFVAARIDTPTLAAATEQTAPIARARFGHWRSLPDFRIGSSIRTWLIWAGTIETRVAMISHSGARPGQIAEAKTTKGQCHR